MPTKPTLEELAAEIKNLKRRVTALEGAGSETTDDPTDDPDDGDGGGPG